MDKICTDKIVECMWSKYQGIPVYTFDETNSTQDRARECAQSPAIFAAESQTAGKGRIGRSFYSPKGNGVYMSVSVPTTALPHGVAPPPITAIVSIAVCRAIKRLCGVSCAIKWVNDIYLNGKKLGGILTEAVQGGQGQSQVVVGIGINFCGNTCDFPLNVQGIVAILFEGCKPTITKSALIAEISCELFEMLEQTLKPFIEEYTALSVVLGKEIIVTSGAEHYLATAIRFNELAHLVVNGPEGIVELSSGEITIRAVETF